MKPLKGAILSPAEAKKANVKIQLYVSPETHQLVKMAAAHQAVSMIEMTEKALRNSPSLRGYQAS